jgi:branched-chain amino acid transport system ATP-binding protein
MHKKTKAQPGGTMAPDGVMLAATGVCAGYGAIAVLHDVNVHVCPGEVVAILGPNGAGKSTLMKVLAGVLPAMSGGVVLERTTAPRDLAARSRAGVAFVPEGRSVFPSLSVRDNLALGRGGVARAVELIPALSPLMNRRAGLLSGGEQQYLSLARAIAGGPKVLLADELSLGLAPLIVSSLLQSVREAAGAGAGVLLVEQHVRQALTVADRLYVLSRGRVVLEGATADLVDHLDEIEAAYLSAADDEADQTVGERVSLSNSRP